MSARCRTEVSPWTAAAPAEGDDERRRQLLASPGLGLHPDLIEWLARWCLAERARKLTNVAQVREMAGESA